MTDDALFLLGIASGLLVTLIIFAIARAIRDAEPLDSFGKKRKP